MTETVALALILLLAISGYAAGRWHGQAGYRAGYRNGYRQGYFDGDRASWHRRRRELQAAVASVLATPPPLRPTAFVVAVPVGRTYTSVARDHHDENAEPETELDASDGGTPEPRTHVDGSDLVEAAQRTRARPRQRATP